MKRRIWLILIFFIVFFKLFICFFFFLTATISKILIALGDLRGGQKRCHSSVKYCLSLRKHLDIPLWSEFKLVKQTAAFGVRATWDGQGYISLPYRALLCFSLCKLLHISVRGIGRTMPCRALHMCEAIVPPEQVWALNRVEWRAPMKRFVFVASLRGLCTMDYEFNLMGRRCRDFHHF